MSNRARRTGAMAMLGILAGVLMACGHARSGAGTGAAPMPSVTRVVWCDTVPLRSGDTLFLLGADSVWPGAIDSVAWTGLGIAGGARLNNGGYQAGHTWLKWTNERYACFGYGCGSPCWGAQVVDLKGETPVLERMYTVLEDSALNLLCYADTGRTEADEQSFIVEQLGTGRMHRATVTLEHVAVPAASIDSAWRAEARICLRRITDRSTSCFEVPWLLE